MAVDPAVVSGSEANRSFSALLARLAAQPASGEARAWQRDDLYGPLLLQLVG